MIAPGGDSEQTLNQSISLQASDDVHSGMIGRPAAEDVRTGHRPNRNCCFPTGCSSHKSWHKCWPRNSRKRFTCYRRPSKRSKTVGSSEGSGMGSNEDVFYEDNEGCYTIGKGESSYELRYFIDLRTQSKHLDEEVMFDECLPCCNSRAERSIGGWFWAFIRSEAFLYSLHMTAILLGGLKEGMDLRKDEDDADIHLEASIIETIATLMLILIRTVNAYRNYQVFKRSILSIRLGDL